jgi:hypothetical protein
VTTPARIEHASVSWLRSMTHKSLRELNMATVIFHRGDPLAVLVPYDQYIQTQNALESVRRAVQKLSGEPR